MANLRVSVVIPTYNRDSLVPRAVASVLPQLQAEDELIVVDDGSTDGTEAALAPWRGRIHYVRLPHGGAGRARNAGWAVARGDLVAFLDSDDEWLPGKLTLQRALLGARPELVYCWTDFATKDAEGRISPHSLASWQETSAPRPWEEIVGPARPLSSLLGAVPEAGGCDVRVGDLYLWLMRLSCVSLMSCLVRRSALPEGLRCAEDLPTYEDWEGVARIARRGPGAFIARDLVLNHRHAGPRLSGARHLAKLQARAAILERVWGTDPVFLARHGAEYGRVLCGVRLALAREHLAQGRLAEARQALQLAGGGPLAYELLARLPPAWVRSGLALRRGAFGLLVG